MAEKPRQLNFRRINRVPLEAPPVPEPRPPRKAAVASTGKSAVRSSVAKPRSHHAAATTRTEKPGKSRDLGGTTLRPLSVGAIASALGMLVERASVGEFRGLKTKPDVVLSAKEYQAITQCLAKFQAPMSSNGKVSVSSNGKVSVKGGGAARAMKGKK
jgi:hypothetical protein